MSSLRIKAYLSSKILEMLKGQKDIHPAVISKLLLYDLNEENGLISLKLPFISFSKLIPDYKKEDFQQFLRIQCDDTISSVATSTVSDSNMNIVFNINRDKLMESVLLNVNQSTNRNKIENIVLDYSSPNIAKPFHMGHLRSTIIGNFLANLYEYSGHNVKRITYLGDWGTQFGVLQIGIQQLNMSNADLKKEPLKQLYNAYVVGNRLVEEEEEAADHARKIFSRLEFDDSPLVMERWKLIREATVSELTKIYDRLNVRFDDYHWESTYNARAFTPILQVLEANGLIKEEDGKKMIELEGGKLVPLLKSDGTTLYLSRDVAAALDRWVSLRFDRMLYVVDNSQNQHFTALKQVLRRLDYDWAEGVEHVKFGRLQGMSTRKGRVVFLQDILDEAQARMAEKQRQTSTTKNYSKEVSDVLGVSAIIVNDLKQRRLKDYTFSWDTALQAEGDSGVKLQYTHCRLCSLEENCGVSVPDICLPHLLREPEATELLLEIARFEEAVNRAETKMEAYEIVNYLFKLCNKTSQALKILNVKHQPAEVAEQRLLLFHRARMTLHTGMKLLGLHPLTNM